MRLAITSWPMWKSRSLIVCSSREGLLWIRCAAAERVALSLCIRTMRAVGRHDQVFLQHATHVPASLPGRLSPWQSPHSGPTLLRFVGRVQTQQRSAAPGLASGGRSGECGRPVRGVHVYTTGAAYPPAGAAGGPGGVLLRCRCQNAFWNPYPPTVAAALTPPWASWPPGMLTSAAAPGCGLVLSGRLLCAFSTDDPYGCAGGSGRS